MEVDIVDEGVVAYPTSYLAWVCVWGWEVLYVSKSWVEKEVASDDRWERPLFLKSWVEKNGGLRREARSIGDRGIGSLMHIMAAIVEKSNRMRVNDSGFVKGG